MDKPTIVVMGFKTELEKRKGSSEPVAVDWVRYAPRTAIQTTQVWDRVEKLRPPPSIENDDEGKKMDFMRVRWAMIEPAYNAWKTGQEIPLNGIPLAAWSGVTAPQIEYLAKQGVKTVQELAAVGEAIISKMPFPGARELPALARDYLASSDKTAIAEQLAEQRSLIAELQEQLEAAKALLSEEVEKRGSAKEKKAA